jgi:hypothetical protein
MAMYSRVVVLAKRETTYGTDASPTESANTQLFQDVTWTPFEADQVERPRVLPWYGNDPMALVATRARLAGAIDWAGSGTAGTAPAFACHLRACGMREVIVSSPADAQYWPVTGGEESETLWHNLDGALHRGLGARGDFSLDIQAGQVPKLRFDLQGMYVQPTAATLPTAPAIAAFIDPLPVSQTNTPTAKLNGVNVVLRSFSYTHGNQLAVRDLPNSKSIRIIGRQPRATMTFEAPDLATTNFYAQLGNQVAAQVIHGTVAGNICEAFLGQARLMSLREINENNIVMLQAELRPEPSSTGNDEIKMSFK